MPMITVDDGTQLFFREVGEGARTVVLVHGWWLNGVLWDDVAPHLARQGYRVLVPDLRGAGSSDKPGTDYSAHRHAADLATLMRECGTGDDILVGHSTGGLYAQLVAGLHPDVLRALVLVCPLPVDGVEVPPEIEALFSLGGDDTAIRGMVLTLARRTLPDERVRMLVQASHSLDKKAYTAAFDTIRNARFSHVLPQVRVPTLVVSADDAYVPDGMLRTRVTRRIGGARQVLIPECGHYVPVERPRELAAILGAFLAGLPNR